MRSTPTTARTLTVAVTALLVAGCGGVPASGPTEPSPSAVPATTSLDRDEPTDPTPTDAAPTDPAPTPPGERDTTETDTDAGSGAAVERSSVARAADHLDVHDRPGSSTVTHRLPPTTELGSPRVLPVLDDDGDWLEVGLPVRPNGTTGWVRRDEVEVSEVDVAVAVDLDARQLTVVRDGEVLLTTAVAIGDADHPTPTGTFSVTDKLDTGETDGPYGPFALGLSARSEVLTEFAGGDGQVGIHGTDTPSSIGQAASHGCLRVPNDVVVRLAELLPLGTPVTVS